MKNRLATGISLLGVGVLSAAASAGMTNVTVTIENLAPQNGTYQTPFWVGFHNGNFDVFDTGSTASAELESLAEDGNVMPLNNAFGGSGNGAASGVIAPGGPFAPGDIASMSFQLDTSDPNAAFFSYASMVIPSNDAFVGNDDAMGHQIFDDDGHFIGADFFITGSDVLDAGTEMNTEAPEHTAFFGQSEPNTGVDEDGVVHNHPGYLGSSALPGESPSILADSMFSGADFTLDGYPIARVTVTPAPGGLALLGLAGLVGRRRRRE